MMRVDQRSHFRGHRGLSFTILLAFGVRTGHNKMTISLGLHKMRKPCTNGLTILLKSSNLDNFEGIH
jgi:hypothetical protein